MSNETPVDKKPPQTRIPVSHIYWADHTDHAGAGQVSNTKCGQDPPGVAKYWMAVFIPAIQHIELTFVSGVNAIPIIEMIPIMHVKRWKP